MKEKTYIGLLYNDYSPVVVKLFFKAHDKQKVIDWMQSYFQTYIKENESLVYYGFKVEKEQRAFPNLNFYDSVSYKKYKEGCYFCVDEIEDKENVAWITL